MMFAGHERLLFAIPLLASETVRNLYLSLRLELQQFPNQ